jgi:hypothetical protein
MRVHNGAFPVVGKACDRENALSCQFATWIMARLGKLAPLPKGKSAQISQRRNFYIIESERDLIFLSIVGVQLRKVSAERLRCP